MPEVNFLRPLLIDIFHNFLKLTDVAGVSIMYLSFINFMIYPTSRQIPVDFLACSDEFTY